MDWGVWDEIESALLAKNIKPILAVVPDNKDPELEVGEARDDFWDRVRGWQAKGWTIGLHGYQHRYVTGEAGIIGLNYRSEFAGLPESEQREKLTAAVAIFKREQVKPDLWVAPGHSFDSTTVKVLRELGITVISDGFTRLPFRDSEGTCWLPQQIWRFRKVPDGVFTICMHPNGWTQKQTLSFKADMRMHAGQITSVAEVIQEFGNRAKTFGDVITWNIMQPTIRVKTIVGGFARALFERN